jgi:hypothetical protein
MPEASGNWSSGTFENNMTQPDRSGSFKNFPPDLLIMSGLPFVAIALFVSWLSGLHDTQWIVAYFTAFLISAVGAALLFRAKLPLYRKGIYFSIGASALPEPMHAVYRRGMILSIIGIFLSAILVTGSFLWR